MTPKQNMAFPANEKVSNRRTFVESLPVTPLLCPLLIVSFTLFRRLFSKYRLRSSRLAPKRVASTLQQVRHLTWHCACCLFHLWTGQRFLSAFLWSPRERRVVNLYCFSEDGVLCWFFWPAAQNYLGFPLFGHWEVTFVDILDELLWPNACQRKALLWQAFLFDTFVTPSDTGLDGLAQLFCSPSTKRNLLSNNEAHLCLCAGMMANIFASPYSEVFLPKKRETVSKSHKGAIVCSICCCFPSNSRQSSSNIAVTSSSPKHPDASTQGLLFRYCGWPHRQYENTD